MGIPRIINDRLFVPVRFVSEKLLAAVQWDELNHAIYVTKQPAA
jgi:hypothetical protein